MARAVIIRISEVLIAANILSIDERMIRRMQALIRSSAIRHDDGLS